MQKIILSFAWKSVKYNNQVYIKVMTLRVITMAMMFFEKEKRVKQFSRFYGESINCNNKLIFINILNHNFTEKTLYFKKLHNLWYAFLWRSKAFFCYKFYKVLINYLYKENLLQYFNQLNFNEKFSIWA